MARAVAELDAVLVGEVLVVTVVLTVLVGEVVRGRAEAVEAVWPCSQWRVAEYDESSIVVCSCAASTARTSRRRSAS